MTELIGGRIITETATTVEVTRNRGELTQQQFDQVMELCLGLYNEISNGALKALVMSPNVDLSDFMRSRIDGLVICVHKPFGEKRYEP